MIFSDFIRTDATPRKFSEPRVRHLDRSVEPEYFRIRELLESWATHVPGDNLFDLEQRIRSGDDRDFDSAFFKLYIHELLLRTGHEIVHHPVLPATKKRPDFSRQIVIHARQSLRLRWRLRQLTRTERTRRV